MNERDKSEPLYVISVVSRMLGVHPQTLRLYEREGLVCPKRRNRQRQYSENDIEKIDLILQLTREMGVNKAGVEIILRMKKRMESLQKEMEDMMKELDDEMQDDFRRRLRDIFGG
ncbi:MAG: MerR family transcriptional regulator [Nitrospirota bacterium]|nr:MAG: MerR family transcriptional regulator [Nitrospirota bacterium]